MTFRRPATRILATSLVVLAVPVAAFAYWTATGSGEGGAVAGATRSLAIAPGTPASALYPGTNADVALVVSNPNRVPVRVPQLALDGDSGAGGFAVDAGHAGCDVSALSFTSAAQSNGGDGWTIPAGDGAIDGSLAIALNGAVSLGSGAADGCQGAAVSVYLKVIGL